jgi:hypothetical protein
MDCVYAIRLTGTTLYYTGSQGYDTWVDVTNDNKTSVRIYRTLGGARTGHTNLLDIMKNWQQSALDQRGLTGATAPITADSISIVKFGMTEEMVVPPTKRKAEK